MSYEITIEGGSSKKLLTAGKYCDRDIVVTATGGGGGTGGGADWNDVTFIDYDGTVLYSYTTAEAKALTEMPPLPTQPGLICQGWNYDLETIKSYDTPVTVGATYITDDGKTRIYITLNEGRTSPMLGCCPNGTVTVDWGDGSEPDVLTGTSTSTVKWTPTHNYAAPGDYVISLTVDGTVELSGSSSSVQYSYLLHHASGSSGINRGYINSIKKIEIGSNVKIGSYAFYYCYSLSSITIPDSVTRIGSYAFATCCSLSSITIPNGVMYIDSNVFYYCYSLNSVAIPDSVTQITSYAFQYCCSLSSIAIPDSVTLIGSNAFQYCYSLSSITIPDGVTEIRDNAFHYCYSLSSITIPDSVTLIGKSCFNNCAALSSITIPDSVTSIKENIFYECRALSSITIPDGATSIGTYAFYNCWTLTSLIIPAGVTTISGSTFFNCYSIRYIDFTSHTSVPALANSNAFTGIAADCEFRVPAALYDEWVAATNWSTYASQIVAV